MGRIDTGKPRLRKFHVGTGQSDQEIIDQFVVRRNELDSVLEVLEGNIDTESCQHLLVVAPRGRGKTTLLVRVIAELRTSRRFSEHLLPVRLMEESQEIFTLADFWLECLYYLAKSCAGMDKKLADELVASYSALVENWTDTNLESRARATVLDAADRLGRRLVIMVENLQALCDEADGGFGWDLRQVLQSEPQVMLLATATSRFAGLENAKEPFFELFRILCLPPLDAKECRRLWQAISGESVNERGIKPLRILTGGSPRLMVILAGFARERSLRQLMEQLVEMIDDHTEYFRGHIEELASKERRVYIALIDLWQASTAAEIAARARMEIRIVSSLLGRLVNRGAVVDEKTGKKRTYYAAERLYSIYYKLRRDRDEAAVVRNLIHFMATYYQGVALAGFLRRLVAEASEFEGIREGLVRAAMEMPELRGLVEEHGLSLPALSPKGDHLVASEAIVEIRQLFADGENDAVVRLADQYLRDSFVGDSKATQALLWKGAALDRLGDSAGAIETYDLVVAHFGDSKDEEFQVLVAMALVNKGVNQGQLGDSVGAIESFESVLARFGESENRKFQFGVAKALVNKGVGQRQLGDSVGAIETYDSLVARFGGSKEREFQVQVATALVDKGVSQGQLGDSVGAIETYDSLVARFGGSKEREFQVPVAKALVNKGFMQGKLGESAGEIATYDSVVARFGDSEDREFQVQVATALVDKGVTQGQLGDSAGGIATYDSVVDRFGNSECPELQFRVATAMSNAGKSLSLVGDAEGALRKAKGLRTLAKRTGLESFVSHADWVEAMAHALLGRIDLVDERFREIYSGFDPSDEKMLRTFQAGVPTLVALGAAPDILATVLEEEEDKYEVLRPLAVALRLEAGEEIRAPAEMLEVAADIRAAIEQKRKELAR